MQGGRFSARVRAPPASASAPRRALVHARDLPAVRRAHESPSSFWIEAFPATLSDFPFKGSSGATDDLCTPRGGAVSLALASVSQLGRPGSPPPRPPMLNDRSEGLDETFPGRRSFDASSGSHPRFRPAPSLLCSWRSCRRRAAPRRARPHAGGRPGLPAAHTCRIEFHGLRLHAGRGRRRTRARRRSGRAGWTGRARLPRA